MLEIVQGLNRVSDRELILVYPLPVSSIQRSNHQVLIAYDLRVESAKDSGKYILQLVLVGNEQITVGTVAADLIEQQWLIWVDMDEQGKLALPGLVCTLRATGKPLCWLLRISVLKLGTKQRMRNLLATCLIWR